MDATTKRTRLNRRDFLRGAAVAGAAMAGGGALAGCQTEPQAESTVAWDQETDVVVVGYGGAGAAAAATAATAGAEVIVLEKRAVAGGTTAISGGVYYAGGTSVQAEHGIEDSAEQMLDHYMNAGDGRNDPELSRIACEMAADNIDWLLALGASIPNPPSVAGAEVHVGSEPIARVHSIGYGDLSGGGAFFQVMADAAESQGAEVLMGTPALRLVVNDQGAVTGIVAESEGEEIAIKARKGVILTTGGFTRHSEMLKACSQGFRCQPLGVPGLTGDGHHMAFGLGADMANILEILGIPGLTLPGAERATYAMWMFSPDLTGILVNEEGKRFIDEFAFYDWKNTALMHQPHSRGFSIFDETMRAAGNGRIVQGFSETLEDEVTDGTVFRAETIADLADQIGIPAENLERTIGRWNAAVASEEGDMDFGRTAGLGAIETAPFFAFETFPTMFDTMGGVRISTDAQVLNVEGQPIPHLYAAGMVTGGVLGEHYPGSGSSYNTLVTFGRIAGEKAAAEEAAA